MHSSSKSCVALMFGMPSSRRATIGHDMRNAWIRAHPRAAYCGCGFFCSFFVALAAAREGSEVVASDGRASRG
jgi:hypothetical protein